MVCGIIIGIDRILKVGEPGARVTLFGGSAYEVLFIYRNRLHYTTENNCQKVEVPGTITLKKSGCPGTQAPMVTTSMGIIDYSDNELGQNIDYDVLYPL
jgi:hypothetical protein